jgi:hypothetical protein
MEWLEIKSILRCLTCVVWCFILLPSQEGPSRRWLDSCHGFCSSSRPCLRHNFCSASGWTNVFQLPLPVCNRRFCSLGLQRSFDIFLTRNCIQSRLATGKYPWRVVLIKDFLVATPILVLIVLTSCGYWNTCYCWCGGPVSG